MPNLNAYPLTRTATPIRVWTRTTWTDAWTLRPDLQCTQLVWASYPETSTASLHYRYGYILQPGQSAPTIHPPITARGYWVLVAIDTDDGPPAVWVGYAENPITRPLAAASDISPATGNQTIPCYGLERIWDHCYVESTVALKEEETDEELNRFARRGNVAAVFNGPNRRGYRSRELGTLDDERDWIAAGFARPTDKDVHVWNTSNIIQHLLGFHAPTQSRILALDPDPAVEIPWLITGLINLPDYDAPQVDTTGKSIGDILRTLITPGRMLGLTFSNVVTIPPHGSTEQPFVTAVNMAFATRLTQPTTIPDIGELPFDPTGISLACKNDPLTTVEYRLDDSDVVDQIIVQGPREISVCTIEHSETQWQDDWDEDDAEAYDTGASDYADWATLTNSKRGDLNRARRNQNDLLRVYRNLILDDAFDGKVREGKSMFPNASTGGNATGPALHVPHLGSVEILPDLPLYAGVDYEGEADEVDESTGTWKNLPILTTFEKLGVDDTKRVTSDGMNGIGVFIDSQFRSFKLEVKPDDERGPGIALNVIGAPQFMVVEDSTPNEADGLRLTAYDHTTIETTVAVRGDRRPIWAQPAELPPLDVIRRRLYTYEDPELQQIYIVPETVLAITDDGDRTTAAGGMLRNPLPKLRALANLIATYVHAPRYRVQIQTARILSTLPVGANLRTIDVVGTDVQSPIVEIRIDAPLAETIDRTGITCTITAAAHRFDVLSLI